MLHFIKDNKNNFSPLSPSDLKKWQQIKSGKVYCMRYRSDRNYEHHKKLFAICKTIIDNVSEDSPWNNKEPYNLIKSAEIQLGFVNEIIGKNGEIYLEPESISFENWSQEKFEEFYSKAIPFLAEWFGYTIEELENNSEYNL